jgi:hypothetical protein
MRLLSGLGRIQIDDTRIHVIDTYQANLSDFWKNNKN